ncbi:MAG: hypothetical protein M3R64_06780, partial [Pseudomonadota bacterium]|nr:hypothetical protein [Pseudomonadota bacterium]
FMPLATRIRQDGLPVYGFGGTKTPEAFKRVCTRFIDVDALLKEKRAPAKPTVEVPIDEALPAPIGTTSPTRAAATSKDATAVDDEVVKLLIDAYDSVKRDERGYVSVSEMGQLAGNRSSFDARNYGYRRLGDLIQAVPNFQTERRDDGRLFVKRVR